MSKKVLTGAERKAQLLEAGAKLAARYGAENVTRRMVATECKCAEGLVNVYMGTAAEAQKAYARKAKAMGYALKTKAEAATIGAKLRAHGPRDKRDTRKRSIKEVEAIKRKKASTDSLTASRKAVARVDNPRKQGGAAKKLPSRADSHATTAVSAVVHAKATPARGEPTLMQAASVGAPENKPKPNRERKPVRSPATPVPSPAQLPMPQGAPERKTAARAPKAPPSSPSS